MEREDFRLAHVGKRPWDIVSACPAKHDCIDDLSSTETRAVAMRKTQIAAKKTPGTTVNKKRPQLLGLFSQGQILSPADSGQNMASASTGYRRTTAAGL